MKKRILSLVLAVSLCTSLLVAPAYADDDLPDLDLGMVTSIAKWLHNLEQVSPHVNTGTYAREHYTEYSYSLLERTVFNWNAQSRNFTIKDLILPTYSVTVYFELQPLFGTEFYAIRCFSHVVVDPKNSVQDPYYDNVSALGYWTDSAGNVAVCRAPTAEEEASTSVQSIPRSQAAAVGAYRMVAYEDLYNLAYDYNAQHNYKLAVNTDGVYWAISSRGEYVLANESGLPYGAVGPSSITSGGNSRPDAETGEEQLIDWSRGTAIDGNGDVFNYDGCIYDSSVKTYYIDNHTENYYYTYNYYIEKTYITYIGSSAEYTETYERYYELPDGRSSADLTKEDLEQLNLSMDVVPYQRSADDTRLRSLYHFDGNTEDSSYWNYATSFNWNSGASLTYLESNAFNGCLYLDELAHDFTITLPSSLGSGDFTVDFRYYQAHSGTPSDDSYISIGGQEVLRLTGSNFTFNGTNYATPVGNWNHLAFVRKDGTLYFYLNGVRQGSRALSNALSSIIRFSFGSSQQTYKYLDELRVTNFAVWESNFTPATVPYDTNLALVLPTDTVPVADEYWDIQCDNNLLSEYNLDWWDSFHSGFGLTSSYYKAQSGSDNSSVSNKPYLYIDGVKTSPDYYSLNSDFFEHYSSTTFVSPYAFYPYFKVDTSYGSPSLNSYTSFSSNFSNVISYSTGSVYSFVRGGSLVSFLYSSSSSTPQVSFSSKLPYGDYTISMVSSSGEVGSMTFNWSAPSSSDFDLTTNSRSYVVNVRSDASLSFNGYDISLLYCSSRRNSSWNDYTVSLSISPSSNPGEIVYLALEEGTESTVTAEFVSGVAGIPADDLNTPTLAVRSDIAINKKQIGGVRPSFAERGDVYAMVESGFITSLQQYTGYAWQAVDGRIWTGSRWIPYSSYNVITLSDMYDIADASGQGGYEYIYSQSGFWSWWQKQWLEFKQWYTNVEFSVNNSFDYTNEKIKQTVDNLFMSIGEINTQIEEKIETTFNIDIDIGTGQSNSLGLLSFVQKVFGDLTSGLGGFTSTYLSPDDSLDVIFVPPPPPPLEEIE